MKEKGLKLISTALLTTMLAYTAPVFAYTKDETVYSKLNTQGKNYRTIVSTHLKNSNEDEIIEDLSDLLNIENTNGDEEYTQKDNSIIWKADKEDIYYQGDSEKELPIECNVKYELDGKEISANEIAGKSGKVKITLNYINKDEHIVNINGKDTKLYTPFVVVAGTVINNDKNKNINISNGKIINDGTKSILMGMAMPGLQESLNIKKSEIEIPSSIEITIEAQEFETNSIITFVTPKVIEKSDIEVFDKLDILYSEVNTLQNSANQIEDGSKKIATGSKTLSEAVKQLNKGTNEAYNGATTIKKEIEKSTTTLKDDKSEALDNKTIDMIGVQASSIANKELSSSIDDIGKYAESTTSNIQLTAEDKNNIALGVKAGLEANSNYKALPEEQQKIILQFAQQSAINSSETVAKNTAKKVANQTAQSVAKTVTSKVATDTAKTTAKEVANQVKSTAQTEVISQMNQLQNGLQKLTNGLYSINNGANKIEDGAEQLSDKTNLLSEGVSKFNSEGINKICSYINSNVKDTSKRIEKLTELADQYDNFTMLNKDNEGSAKFIMIIDAIKKQDENDDSKEQAVLDININKESNEQNSEE